MRINRVEESKSSRYLGDEACTIACNTVADEIIAYARDLSERASKLSSFAHDKLIKVMRESEPCPEGMCMKARTYPPYFSALRDIFQTIDLALSDIEDTMERTEL